MSPLLGVLLSTSHIGGISRISVADKACYLFCCLQCAFATSSFGLAPIAVQPLQYLCNCVFCAEMATIRVNRDECIEACAAASLSAIFLDFMNGRTLNSAYHEIYCWLLIVCRDSSLSALCHSFVGPVLVRFPCACTVALRHSVPLSTVTRLSLSVFVR